MYVIAKFECTLRKPVAESERARDAEAGAGEGRCTCPGGSAAAPRRFRSRGHLYQSWTLLRCACTEGAPALAAHRATGARVLSAGAHRLAADSTSRCVDKIVKVVVVSLSSGLLLC